MTTIQVNTKAQNAVTQFTGLPFNSACVFKNRVLLATENGLLAFDDSLADTSNVNAYFELIKSDFGIPKIKKLRFIYLSYSASEDLLMTVSTEQGLSQQFNIPANLDGQQGYRLPVSHALYGRYWTFRISNASETTGASGADFSIDEIKILPLVKVHGLNHN